MTAVDTVLPDGFGVRLAAGVHACDGGATLLGGSPATVLVLSPQARGRVSGDGTLHAVDPVSRGLARALLDRGLADPVWGDPAPPDAQVRDVTVVVPVRDRAGELDRLLGALPAGVPVVVVDDGSHDPGPVRRVAERHGARLVAHPHNRGPAAARNTGLRAVATAYVAFCDSDVVPDPGWLGTLRRHLEDPAVALVAPRVLGAATAPGDGWLDRYEQARSSLDLGPRPASVRLHGAVAYVPSACLLARVDALGPGFDEGLRSGEDVDLVWRLLAGGAQVRYEPAATVRHRHRTRLLPWARRKAFYGTSAAPLAARHGDAVAPLVLSPWTGLVAVGLLAQRPWSAPLLVGGAAVTTARLSRRLERVERPVPAAATLVARAAVGGAAQTASSLTRHHWPLAVLAATRSRRARRALLVAAVVEGLVDHRRHRPALDPVRYVAAHRLDDLAYGAGVWWGALRTRSARALLPRLAAGTRGRQGRQGRQEGSRPVSATSSSSGLAPAGA